MRIFLILMCLAGCEEASTPLTERCDISLSALSPSSAVPGASVIATVDPVSSSWDTVVQVGNAEADVEAVARTDCEECDACRVEQTCTDCETCSACDDECRDRCLETVQFTVPDVSEGDHAVSVLNKHGHSNSLVFTVLQSTNTSDADSGQSDSGSSPADTAADTAR